MADDYQYKLIHAVDPTKKSNPAKFKYTKLTLSANKKQAELIGQQRAEHQSKRQSASRNLMDSICAESAKLFENPLLRSETSTQGEIDWQEADTQHNTLLETEGLPSMTRPLEDSEFMEPLHVSGDNFSQTLNEISQRVSAMTVTSDTASNNAQPSKVQQNKELAVEASICISTTTDTDDDVSCITISDSVSNEDTKGPTKTEEPCSMLTSEHVNNSQILPNPIGNEKLNRIEQFLRDVSIERHEMERRGDIEFELDLHKRLASADTETMSQTTEPDPVPYDVNNYDNNEMRTSANVAGMPAEADESKRLADNDTELNTIASGSDLVSSDCELTTPTQQPEIESPMHSKTDPTLEESVTIPETSSEDETLDNTKSNSQISEHASRQQSRDSIESACIQMSNINISAKINIKIQVSNVESVSDTTTTSDDEDGKMHAKDKKEPDESPPNQSHQRKQAQAKSVESAEKDEPEVEDPNFLTHAQNLLNELYGKSWQTPDVMRTLKRCSGSDRKRVPQTEPKLRPMPTSKVTRDKGVEKPPATSGPNVKEESMLADFTIFKRNICKANMNSTHMEKSSNHQPTMRAPQKRSEPTAKPPRSETRKPQRRIERPRTVLKQQTTNHQERWRKLIDDDSGSDSDIIVTDDDEPQATMRETDDSDDDDTDTDCTKSSSSSSDRLKSNRSKKIVYLDLTKDEVELQDENSVPYTPAANDDRQFQKHLEDILRTCRRGEKPKLEATPKAGVINKRRLFTPNIGYENDAEAEKLIKNARAVSDELLEDMENVYPPGTPVHKRLQQIKKNQGDSDKKMPSSSELIFKPATSNTTPKARTAPTKTPSTIKSACALPTECCKVGTPGQKYSFLKSLEPSVPKSFCDPSGLFYRENYSKKKEELAQKLFEMYNADLFGNKLDVPLTWNKKLKNSAGRCANKTRNGQRMCVIELSDKVLTSADRLRCTLMHELCHAATWIFNGENGHGATWKKWAARANYIYPELPKIGVCHQYEIEYKYTYKCTLCAAKSHAHSKSKKAQDIRCVYCRGAIEILLNKKDKEGNIVSKPVREATGFAKFVKEQYKQYKDPNLAHGDVMRLLSTKYAMLKEGGSAEK